MVALVMSLIYAGSISIVWQQIVVLLTMQQVKQAEHQHLCYNSSQIQTSLHIAL
jgi:hypothetical protein